METWGYIPVGRGGSRGGAVVQLHSTFQIWSYPGSSKAYKNLPTPLLSCSEAGLSPSLPFPLPPICCYCFFLLYWGLGNLQSCSCSLQPGFPGVDSAGNSNSNWDNGWGWVPLPVPASGGTEQGGGINPCLSPLLLLSLFQLSSAWVEWVGRALKLPWLGAAGKIVAGSG